MAVWIHGENDLSLQEVRHIFQAVDDLQRMTQELHLRYPLPFPLRIGTGVNTGYAMVGNTGSYDRPDYTALGDTVNEAFRLESCTKELKQDVAIGLTTYQYLRMLHPGNYEHMFEEYQVHLKGYDEPATTYAGTYEELNRVLTGLVEGAALEGDNADGDNGVVEEVGVDEVYGEEIELDEEEISETIPSRQEIAGGLEGAIADLE